MSDITRT